MIKIDQKHNYVYSIFREVTETASSLHSVLFSVSKYCNCILFLENILGKVVNYPITLVLIRNLQFFRSSLVFQLDFYSLLSYLCKNYFSLAVTQSACQRHYSCQYSCQYSHLCLMQRTQTHTGVLEKLRLEMAPIKLCH